MLTSLCRRIAEQTSSPLGRRLAWRRGGLLNTPGRAQDQDVARAASDMLRNVRGRGSAQEVAGAVPLFLGLGRAFGAQTIVRTQARGAIAGGRGGAT